MATLRSQARGVTAESLNMASLGGYSIGGTLHIITNNLLGFTALPEESNSTRFSTDLAKRLPIPIFHVNAEDPGCCDAYCCDCYGVPAALPQ